ncbi:unnamed protein product [Closterium sp. NIES-65]|nr:unnamed protein product [Closterium sp. NIES-65]
MASRYLVSGLPRSLPPLSPGPALTCVPCVEGRLRAAPHSSEFPSTKAPLQTLYMDVWGPARVRGQGHERYFLLVVDDYSRYTMVFPLRSKGDVTEQNGIAERRIGMVMDVSRTSMIHAAAPYFLWPFAVQYAAHQFNLQPRVSLPETSPTLRWTGKVGDASAFRVWGSRAFVRDLSADKLSPRAVPCVFLGFPPDAPGWQFYHPTSRRVLSSQDVTFDESVPYYRVSQVDTVKPVDVAVDSGAARGAEPGGVESGGAEPGGAELGGAWPGGAEPGGMEPRGAEPGGATPGGAGSARVASGGARFGAPLAASSRRELPSPQELREWFARRWSRATGAGGAAVTADPGVGTGVTGATGPGGARTGGTKAAGTWGAAGAAGVGPAGGTAGAAGGTGANGPAGVGAARAARAARAGAAGGVGAGGAAGGGASEGSGVGAVGAGGDAGAGAAAGGTGAVPAGSGGAARQRPYFALLLEQVIGLPPCTGPAPPLKCPQPVQSESQLQPTSPLLAPSPYIGPTGGLAEPREPASRPALTVRAARTSSRAPRPCPPAVLGTHQMALRPSTAPLRVPLPSPPESSLPILADPDTDVLEDRQEEFQCFAAALPHLVSTLIAPEGDPDAPDIPTPRSYAEAIEGP